MADGGKILAKIMKELEQMVKPGITTKELDRVAETLISCPSKPWAKADKIQCSFKEYKSKQVDLLKPFPACLCTSINEEIVHSAPSARTLRQGDIISLDLGIFFNGFHTDMAITVPVGRVSEAAEKLIKVTEEALKIAIQQVKPGNHLGDISWLIQSYVESQNLNVIKELCGHGIGKALHEPPQILNFGEKGTGPEIKEGMVFCLEPMVTIGDAKIKKSQDDFGWQTADGSLSCHFEHTVAVTKEGCQVLTKNRDTSN